MGATKKTENASVEAAALPVDQAAPLPFDERPALHKAFRWCDPNICDYVPAHAAISFFNRVRDIAAGAATVMDILEVHDLDAEGAEDDERPLLSVNDRASLNRLAIGALESLSELAERNIGWVQAQAPTWPRRKGGPA